MRMKLFDISLFFQHHQKANKSSIQLHSSKQNLLHKSLFSIFNENTLELKKQWNLILFCKGLQTLAREKQNTFWVSWMLCRLCYKALNELFLEYQALTRATQGSSTKIMLNILMPSAQPFIQIVLGRAFSKFHSPDWKLRTVPFIFLPLPNSMQLSFKWATNRETWPPQSVRWKKAAFAKKKKREMKKKKEKKKKKKNCIRYKIKLLGCIY